MTNETVKKFEFELGPAGLFNMDEILDPETLGIEISSDGEIDSQARPGHRVRRIELEFTSQDWHGFPWNHVTRIYLPEGHQPGGNVGIIGTNCEFNVSGNEREFIPETQLKTEAEYAEGTAIDLGLPIMLFLTPGEEINGMHESDLMGYSMLQMAETNDLTWSGYYAIAKSYLRAITLMQALPEVRADKAVLLGCSKRGGGVCIAAGVDPQRVAGVMATCYPGGNHLNSLALKYYSFGPDIGGPAEERTGPGYQPAKIGLRGMYNPLGIKNAMAFDPYLWRNQIKPAYLVALGTNDEFYGLGAPNEMLEAMSGDKAFLAVDNLPHSWVSVKHLAAWRMWLAHAFFGREMPSVTVSTQADDKVLSITSEVAGKSKIEHVKLFYAYNPTTDWRFREWKSVEMKSMYGSYVGELQRKADEHLAYYVEVGHTGEGGLGYISSLVETLRFDH